MNVKIPLQSLEGEIGPYLQIEPHDNGDVFLTLRGQDTTGNVVESRAQLVNPNGGGNRAYVAQYESFLRLLREYTPE